jgi:general secretion pathway protein I
LYRTARSESADAGFTLIEVLVALALVALALAAIGRVVATTSRGVQKLEQRVAEMETLRNLMAGLSPRTQVAAGSRSGETGGQRWRIDVTPWTGGGIDRVADSPWVPETVTIRVQSPTGGSIGVETVRLVKRTNG